MKPTVSQWCSPLVVALVLAGPLGAEEKKPSPPRSAADLLQRLRQPVDLEGFAPNTPFREALGFISEHFGLTILVDAQAFRDELQVQEPEQHPVTLPKVHHVPLRWVVQQLAGQAGGTAVQVGSLLWVAPPERARQRQLGQSLDADFDNVPLGQALQQLANQTGYSVALDASRVADSANVPVTAQLRDVSLETSVRTLADLAGLKAVQLGTLLYVTTPDHAKELEAEEKLRRRKAKVTPPAAQA